ncbi:DEAD/DEAH box helicase family protein [Helicobacter cetorum]|uniref:Type III restriction enzyme, res subunit n=1 Tax=Helicobacter cetorum (strain ATCC BAA-429 / MIT 00-7128) TaxID=182217 RepID=I0EKS8_HELC0|nr:DEAD/DEAH box helicase family protein [Helicobacter cetorum]AFI03547.1 type III restriction enzyme, res subunit [Helicobacter cetorum MIT 00-7128]
MPHTEYKSSFNYILEQLQNISNDKDRGTEFEYFCKQFLLKDPTYYNQFKEVYLRNELLLDNDYKDIGIDLIAITTDNEFVAIQCKCYTKDIAKSDIDSFISASSKSYHNSKYGEIIFKERLLMHIAPRLSANAEKIIENQNPRVFQISKKDFEESQVDYSSFKLNDNTYSFKLKPHKVLRSHQKEAINNILEEFKHFNRTKLIMACGTGKSLTAIRLLDIMLLEQQIALFLAPSIALVSQSLKEAFAQSQKPFKAFVICSDSKVGKEIEDAKSSELPIPPTTNPTLLSEQITKHQNERLIIFSTYHSIEVIMDCLKELKRNIKIAICDEAHRTAGFNEKDKEQSHYTKIHNDNLIKCDYRLYMSATPKIFKERAKEQAKKEELFLYSMDNEEIFGKNAYELNFDNALKQDLLCDYKVIISILDKNLITNSTNQTPIIKYTDKKGKEKEKQVDLEFAGKIIATYLALSKQNILEIDKTTHKTSIFNEDKTPMKTSIAFHSSIDNSILRTSSFKTILDNFDKDTLSLELEHVDGNMNTLEKSEKLDLLKNPKAEINILSNAKCLTEGIDIPSLDSVIFFDSKDSLVEIVQAVGRVMRKAPNKQYGYIILPITMELEKLENYDETLNKHEDFKALWKLLNALRAHDNRLVSECELYKKIEPILGKPPKNKDDSNDDDNDTNNENNKNKDLKNKITQQSLFLQGLKDHIINIAPNKIGDRYYWSSFASNVANIAKNIKLRLKALLADPSIEEKMQEFLKTLHININSSLNLENALDLLTQHVITKPIFECLYSLGHFSQNNAVCASMDNLYNDITKHSLDAETTELNEFYTSIKESASFAQSDKEKQSIIKNLYNTFFAKAFEKESQKLGIVYTPIEIVDFMIHSSNALLKKHFNTSLNEKGVKIADPFLGTGSFLTRLLQSGMISKENLPYKYEHDIFGNEITLLAYYIANLNIASVYNELLGSFIEPKGVCFCDTFETYDKDKPLDFKEPYLEENKAKIKAFKNEENLFVILGNPPYSRKQENANDNNQNNFYPKLTKRLQDTYTKESKAQKNDYDTYKLALRFASDKIQKGVIAFVTNASFLRANSDDGLRASLAKEFNAIYIMDLRGNQRTSGELSKQEGGKVFGSGSRTPVCCVFLIKDKETFKEKCEIFYHNIGDYRSAEDKLSLLEHSKHILNAKLEHLTPDSHNDWLDLRDPAFDKFMPITDKKKKFSEQESVFKAFSSGVVTSRDTWAYNFSKENLAKNIKTSIDFYNSQLGKSAKEVEKDPTKISWSRRAYKMCERDYKLDFNENQIRTSLQRPFTKIHIYYDIVLNEEQCQMDKIYPFNNNSTHANERERERERVKHTP